jgi:hypothetical protein
VGSDFFLVVFLVVWVLSRWFAGLSFFVTLEEYWGCLFGLLIIYISTIDVFSSPMPFVPWLGHHYVLHVGLAFSLLLEHKLYVALVDCFIVC